MTESQPQLNYLCTRVMECLSPLSTSPAPSFHRNGILRTNEWYLPSWVIWSHRQRGRPLSWRAVSEESCCFDTSHPVCSSDGTVSFSALFFFFMGVGPNPDPPAKPHTQPVQSDVSIALLSCTFLWEHGDHWGPSVRMVAQ